MRFYYALLISFIVLSCSRREGSSGYEIPGLKENIKAFINAKKCFDKQINVLVVNLMVEKDTLSVDIADTYPNIKSGTFNYDTVLFGYRVIFTGEKIKGYYKNLPASEFPSDIVEINNKNEWLLYQEFTVWLFKYYSGKLVYKSLPCADR